MGSGGGGGGRGEGRREGQLVPKSRGRHCTPAIQVVAVSDVLSVKRMERGTRQRGSEAFEVHQAVSSTNTRSHHHKTSPHSAGQ
jgi:hypothetical protein